MSLPFAKCCRPNAHSIGWVLFALVAAFWSAAAEPTDVILPSSDGTVAARKWIFPIQGLGGMPPNQTSLVSVVFAPDKGVVLATQASVTNLIILKGRLIGLTLFGHQLRFYCATNLPSLDRADRNSIPTHGIQGFTNGFRSFSIAPHGRAFCADSKAWSDLTWLLGRSPWSRDTVLDNPDGTKWTVYVRHVPAQRTAQLIGVSVQNGMGVALLAGSDGTRIEYGFDSFLRPLYAQTNGVSVGPIPTNSVFFTDVVDGKEVIRVVY